MGRQVGFDCRPTAGSGPSVMCGHRMALMADPRPAEASNQGSRIWWPTAQAIPGGRTRVVLR